MTSRRCAMKVTQLTGATVLFVRCIILGALSAWPCLGEEALTAAQAEQARAMNAALELTGAKKGGKEDEDITLPGGGTLGGKEGTPKAAGIMVSDVSLVGLWHTPTV